MKDIKDTNDKNIHRPSGKRKGWTPGRICRIAGLSIAGLLIFVIAGVTCLTLWLTPHRLTDIVNREASRYLDADIKVSNLRFTLWSSFPRFHIEADSVRIISRSLSGITPQQRDSLPADADFLMSAGRMEGSINVLKLLAGRISLRNVDVADLSLNLVSLNDSVSNFNILPPESRGSFEIPYFTADTLRLSAMRPIRYYSAATSTTLTAPMRSAVFARYAHNAYRLILDGKMSLITGNMEVLRDFPFAMEGNVSTEFHPFSLKLSDFHVGLANVKGEVKMDMAFGDSPSLNNFSYDIHSFNPLELLSYFPGMEAPFMRDIKADVGIVLTARLLKPYQFSASVLPTLAVDFKTQGGSLIYTFSDGTVADVNDIILDGRFMFDGDNQENSDVEVHRLSLRGAGSEIHADGRLTNLTGSPQVEAHLEGFADIGGVSRLLPPLKSFGVEGHLDCDTKVKFTLADISAAELSHLEADGSATLSSLSFNGKGIKGKADGMKVKFDAASADISADGVSSLKGKVSVDIADGEVAGRGFAAGIAGLHFSGTEKGRYSLTIADADFKNFSDSSRIETKNVGVKGTILLTANENLPLFDATATLPYFKMTGPHTGIRLDNTVLSVNTSPSHAKAAARASVTAADAAALKRVAHTPEYMSVNLPADIKRTLSRLDISADARIASGELRTPSFPVANTFRNLSLYADNDRIALRNLKFRSQSSALEMSGSISGLRDFLLSGTPTPLVAELNVALDTVNINQLAHAYARGLVLTKGSDATLSAPKPVTLTAGDTTAMLIPRNIVAKVKASAKETVYTNLHLYDLATDVEVADGNAKVSDLRIGSDFGHAFLSLDYRSQNVLDMGVGLKAGLEDIDVVRFFKRFHTLLLMMPQMRNLSGMVSADAGMNLHIYPNMAADVPSLTADINLLGRDLTVHQDAFIRHITKMMMIHTSADLHIADMNVRASVHDNLLELYPFDFEFDRYRLRMQGLNNFNGRMYYHVGVEKSPVPFPFGINIQGMFHHPEFRFGGAEYKVEKGAEVAAEVMENNTFNIIRELKYYLRQFVKKAAESDNTPESSYSGRL